MPASQARCEALTALVGMPVGLEAGGLRSPHPLLPQLALTGLLALLELKKGNDTRGHTLPSPCDSHTERAPDKLTSTVTSNGRDVSIAPSLSDSAAPLSSPSACLAGVWEESNSSTDPLRVRLCRPNLDLPKRDQTGCPPPLASPRTIALFPQLTAQPPETDAHTRRGGRTHQRIWKSRRMPVRTERIGKPDACTALERRCVAARSRLDLHSLQLPSGPDPFSVWTVVWMAALLASKTSISTHHGSERMSQ